MLARQISSKRSALLASRARQMRFCPTASEERLWRAICGRKLGVAFRRQVVIGEFIVDFLAPTARLVVEVDGGYHERRRRADARRDRVLRRLGYRVLRLSNELVLSDLPQALQQVQDALRAGE